MPNPKWKPLTKARPGKHLVRQERVVQWHAHITQLDREVAYLATHHESMGTKQVDEALSDIRADLGKLRGHLPPIQTELPLK